MAKPTLLKLTIEAIIVGVIITFIGTLVSHVISEGRYPRLPDPRAQKMYLALFLTGLLGHFVFEFMGVNRWYCKNYVK